jgi:DNA-binding FadR family transcriptional regulator
MTLLSDRVHHELKRRLTLWEYLPGTRMGEEALAAEFGVSRTPVRDALRRLEQEGFLEDTEGWTGYRVRKPDLPRMEELYEVRLSLEQAAVRRLAAAPADPEIDELLRVWQQPKGPSPAPDPDMVHADERSTRPSPGWPATRPSTRCSARSTSTSGSSARTTS